MEYVVDDFDAVPELEHTEQVFTGLIDTLDNVAGTESLTGAQHYLAATLYAAGMLPRAQVDGAEGFFSKVGDGVKAAIAYIKKIFESIFGFFRTKSKPQQEKAKATVAKTEANLKAASKRDVTPENVDKHISKAESIVKSAPDSPEKKQAEEKIEKVKEAPAEQKVHDFYNVFPQKFIEAKLDRAKLAAECAKLDKLAEEAEKVNATLVEKSHVKSSIETLPETFKKTAEKIKAIDDIESATAALVIMALIVDTISKSLEEVKSSESFFSNQIKNLEAGGDESKEFFKKELEFAKAEVLAANAVVKISESVAAINMSVCKIIDSCCVIII